MNIANKLTILRIFLAFAIMFFIFSAFPFSKVFALIVFILAALTDYYDGKLAKKYSLVTTFGKLMDPVADKILVLAVFLAFVEIGIVPAWMVVVIILREITVTGIRLVLLNKGEIVQAEKAGKHKTISQMTAIIIILIYMSVKQLNDVFVNLRFWSQQLDIYMSAFIYFIMMITIILTITSGYSFLKANLKKII